MITRRALLSCLPLLAQEQRPNIVVILADDLGWGELGCYGNQFNATPHLDKLADAGVRFTNAYSAAPVCSPMRASYMTGQYPARVGILDFLRADDPNHLSPALPTLPKQFAAAGYRTGLIGKWHLMGDYRTRPGDPRKHGFQEVICSESSYIGPGYYFPPYQHMKEVAPRTPGEYLTDRLNIEACEFIERAKGQPFFLCLNHYAPHTRLAAKPALVAKYKAKAGAGKNRNNPDLAAMLESIDEGVGAIVAMLERLKLLSNTVVMFTSDNGGENNVTTNAHLHGAKSQLYEGGIRVPLIVSAPGAARGATVDTPVSSIDYYPTLLAAAGLKTPPSHTLDGISFYRQVRSVKEASPPERALYWHYPLDKPHFLGGRSAGAVRHGDWKLIEFFDDHSVELFNLREDPSEGRNLAAARPAEVAKLQRMLTEWRQRTLKK